MNQFENILFQFLPIIIIFLLLVKNKEFLQFSNTVFGKILALFIIAFYTSIDKITGLFVSSLVILFYQTNYITNVEQMTTMENMDLMDTINLIDHTDTGDHNITIEFNQNWTDEILDDGVYFENDPIVKSKKKSKNYKRKVKVIKRQNSTQFLDLDSNNKELSGKKITEKDNLILNNFNEINGDIEEEFRKRNCDKNHLVNKGIKVNNEMAPHVYPDLEYKNVTCNPCSKNCEISIIGNKLTTDENLRPIGSLNNT
jgi:hypothetical protein